jgi:hypothetical protein
MCTQVNKVTSVERPSAEDQLLVEAAPSSEPALSAYFVNKQTPVLGKCCTHFLDLMFCYATMKTAI